MTQPTITESARQPDRATYDRTILAGEGWIHVVPRGHVLRIVDVEGNQAVDTLFYNAHDYEDRYSAVDTIRAQGSIYLTTGSRLLTVNERGLLTIVADTCGRHDTLGGACAAESNMVRYALDKRHMHACRDTFTLLAASWTERGGGRLEKRDIAHNINFFMNVPVTPDGHLKFDDGISGPGRYVELEAHVDTLCVISNCPQLNNPCNAYNPTPARVLIWDR